MTSSFTEKRRIRKSYGRIKTNVTMPNLIAIQKSSYDQFLQIDTPKEKRDDTGLQAVFKSIFPIHDNSGKYALEFVSYRFDSLKYDVTEAIQRDITYSAPLKVTFRLIVWDINEDTKTKTIRDIKENEVYMGDIPLMTKNGTFIVNGTERVVVSQMHRSPGVFFDDDQGKVSLSGKMIYSSRIIPYRGSWLDFEFDARDILYVRIDRRRKLPVTTMLMALPSKEKEVKFAKGSFSNIEGMDSEEILNTFYGHEIYEKKGSKWKSNFNEEKFKGHKLSFDLYNSQTGELVANEGDRLTARIIKKLIEEGLQSYFAPVDEIIGRYLAYNVIEPVTGEVLGNAGDEITQDMIDAFVSAKINKIVTLAIDGISIGAYIRNTLAIDKNHNREEALLDIYRVMRPGEPRNVEAAEELFYNLFFEFERYDLSNVGRVKMNSRLGFNTDDNIRVLRKEDIIRTLQLLIDIRDGKGHVDDIDNLGNRRVRSVGELMENQYRIGLLRMERSIRERMSAYDVENALPQDLINAKPVTAAVREFFGSSQLSQFMDQNNPLAEVTHKRRLSALGPGGLTRERAGFEVRDVHPTHYGRICPIETPEGPNIGLINSLATYARVNKYGFIETPYRKVTDGVVQNEFVYMSAMDEGNFNIAQANSQIDKNNKITEELVSARNNGDYVMVKPNEVNYIDVSPKQIVSVAASLIPFLENDDANRALMGSNMQRQAVPLIRAEAPLVGTGMEAIVAKDSGVTVIAKRDGVVEKVDSTRIVIRVTQHVEATESAVDIYRLRKFERSNQNTSINQRPLVKVGDKVKSNDIIADGSSTELGELALGRNVIVAFMPWNGYNYEDSILISERIARDDVFTSIHIEEFEVMSRDTKLGPEEITRDIPNIGEDVLKDIDEAGIVYIGAEVEADDILVGKVTPKGESPATPEEKLLRAIFGEKATDVRDTSLRLPPGVAGTIVGVRVFSRRGIEKDERAQMIERQEINRLAKDRDAERSILEVSYVSRITEILLGQKIVSGPKSIKKGSSVNTDLLETLTTAEKGRLVIDNEEIMTKIEAMRNQFEESIRRLNERFDNKVEKLQWGDELPAGVLKMVKVFVAVKRKLQPGDKMAGRHGNKGVVSRILPIEDMPWLEDGTPVDICLNPLGVPSRMNVGQILETHLGWACAGLGKKVSNMLDSFSSKKANLEELKKELKYVYDDESYSKQIDSMDENEIITLADNLRKGVPIATPVFDGAHEGDIDAALKRAGYETSGQTILIDGRTGEPFERKVTVGIIYMLKLHHLVDDKIHARSVGPYSLVTQQPLGGKAQFGGQRFGEMEVWALEAYGAAYTLQEMLTVKSDDQIGRTKVYEAIIRGEDTFEAGIPESFNVLIKELRSLSLDVDLTRSTD